MTVKINGAEVSNSALVVLLCATLTTLSSGTNYVVGSWAPQYADRLHLSSTQINLVAAAGNWGVYCSGPVFGWIVDKRGPRLPIFAGGALLGAGYLGLYWNHQHGDPSSVSLARLACFSFLTGLGSSAGMAAGLNAVARTFSTQTRGTAMGIVVAGYGLSAFLYATISAYVSGENTAAFLLILSIGTFVSLEVAAFVLSPARMESAYAPLPLSPQPAPPMFRTLSGMSRSDDDEPEDLEDYSDAKLSPDRSDRGGLELFKDPDYWILMVAAFCLTGTGLMWINSVGTVVVTLVQFNGRPGRIPRLQSHQTSLLSVFNCLGRLYSGIVSDNARSRLGILPIWWLLFQSLTFFASQWLARQAATLGPLSWATSLVGFSYGQFFGLAPVILLDWYGMTSFSSNVGWLYVVPTFSSYTFSHLFGAIYDSHTNPDAVAGNLATMSMARVARASALADDGHSHVCPLGRGCYVEAFSWTLTACGLAIALSLTLAVRKGWERSRAVQTERGAEGNSF